MWAAWESSKSSCLKPTAFPLKTGVKSPSFSQGIHLVHSSIITRRNTFRINKDITRRSVLRIAEDNIYLLKRLCGKESNCQYRSLWLNPWVWNMPRRSKWQPTPVLLPEKFHGQRSLVGCSPWGCKELDMTERLWVHTHTWYKLSYLALGKDNLVLT